MEKLDPRDWDRDIMLQGRWLDLFEDPVAEEEDPFGDKETLAELIKEGRLLLRYDEANKAKYAKTYAFETTLKKEE